MKLPEPRERETVDQHDAQSAATRFARRRRLAVVALIFFTALGVRLLNWHGHGGEVSAVQSSVVLNYKHQARLIQANGLASLHDASSTTNDPDLLGHPLGYPILLSFIYRVAESDTATQLLQIVLDSLSAVLIALIAFELFPVAVGMIAGLFAAFAPQFSWNSLLLLPDTLAALPILVAMLLIVRACQPVGQAFLPVQFKTLLAPANLPGQSNKMDRQECLSYLAAGALIGVSCWLRANALLLAPFLTLLFPLICKRGKRLGPALMLVCGACLIIAPLTIRNATVFGKFIPVSLGAGQTLIEGISDYNTDGTLGLPQTDMDLIRGEAKTSERPDYANSLFTPDGPARDRARLSRGFAVIRAHPVWFAGVMVRRAASMLRLERTPLRLSAADSGAWLLVQWPLRFIQKLFVTAVFLPLVLLGAVILVYRRRLQSLAMLLAVPFYYFCTQSALHTEYRYVLVIHYFLFVLAALAVYTLGCKITASWKAAR
jgi:4-amino-4-deoxy-L-arabinose transferase-like glycosyltransferase